MVILVQLAFCGRYFQDNPTADVALHTDNICATVFFGLFAAANVLFTYYGFLLFDVKTHQLRSATQLALLDGLISAEQAQEAKEGQQEELERLTKLRKDLHVSA